MSRNPQRTLNAFVYIDETTGNDENSGDHPSVAVRTMERARQIAGASGKCRGIKKLNDSAYQQQLLAHTDMPLPCGDTECRPCLRAASIAKCFSCGKRTWQQAMKAGLCRDCTKNNPSAASHSRMAGGSHAQARYNANRRIRRLLSDIRRECEVNDYQAFIGLRLGNQVHTFAFNCCVPTAHGQAIAFHCEDGTVLPQDLDVTNDKSITDSIEKTGTKEAVTWHRVRQSLVQWHKSFKTDRQIKDRINKAKKNLKLCQKCIFTVPNEPLEPHASLSEPLASQVGTHDQPISAATTDGSHGPPEQQYVGVVVDDQDRAQHPHAHPHPHPHQHPHHPVPVSMPQHLPAMKAMGHPMPDENPAKAAKMMNMVTMPNLHQGIPQPIHMQQMPGMHHMPPMSMAHLQHPQPHQQGHHPQHPQHPPPQHPQQGQGQPQQGQQQGQQGQQGQFQGHPHMQMPHHHQQHPQHQQMQQQHQQQMHQQQMQQHQQHQYAMVHNPPVSSAHQQMQQPQQQQPQQQPQQQQEQQQQQPQPQQQQ
ncbi:hypothetical protein PTSG_12127 [Salpingoeca rosetta]|uniref:Uncharacterized protein n=1 Tax=Salpingoeca rosetta (strain ATCC 50818 / BSB-021) TaxID=946362 RepID=F2U6K9_SALR5|nr:uncharacterized protein PTSG_12127 [Salpingoeca rosetta]EGD83491.1 hypothetical protein PTSG_12127 [Salpingoeca rosetta]|eukprot:XP_004994995.1 hypothetical protein PTSG_12127 [Salpingoeca rosetta]